MTPQPPRWLCPACGSNNMLTAAACFRCQAPRPTAAAAPAPAPAAAAPAYRPTPAPPAIPHGAPRVGARVWLIVALVVAVVAGVAGAWWLRGRAEEAYLIDCARGWEAMIESKYSQDPGEEARRLKALMDYRGTVTYSNSDSAAVTLIRPFDGAEHHTMLRREGGKWIVRDYN